MHPLFIPLMAIAACAIMCAVIGIPLARRAVEALEKIAKK
jgi:hypothetical protein